MSQKPLELSPISAWSDGELIELPSGKVMRLRQLDVLSVIGEDGSVPNFLLPLLSRQKSSAEPNPEDILKMGPLLNKVALQSVVEPAIVNTMDQVKAGEGILLSMISMEDKMTLLSYAMGGAAAINATMRFQRKQAEPLAVVQPEKQRVTEFAASDS